MFSCLPSITQFSWFSFLGVGRLKQLYFFLGDKAFSLKNGEGDNDVVGETATPDFLAFDGGFGDEVAGFGIEEGAGIEEVVGETGVYSHGGCTVG